MCVNVPFSVIRTADQARGKVGGVKWLVRIGRRSFGERDGEDGNDSRAEDV